MYATAIAVQMPVMVTFASVGPMIAIGLSNPGYDEASISATLIAPRVSKMPRFFPHVVTGTIGLPLGATAPKTVNPEHVVWRKQITDRAAATGSTLPAIPKGLGPAPSVNNPAYASLPNMGISAVVLIAILCGTKYGKALLPILLCCRALSFVMS